MLDLATHTATRAGRGREPTARDLAPTELLMSAPGRVFDRERILGDVRGAAADSLINMVSIHFRRLRRKLALDGATGPVITTVRRRGYRIELLSDRSAFPLTPE